MSHEEFAFGLGELLVGAYAAFSLNALQRAADLERRRLLDDAQSAFKAVCQEGVSFPTVRVEARDLVPSAALWIDIAMGPLGSLALWALDRRDRRRRTSVPARYTFGLQLPRWVTNDPSLVTPQRRVVTGDPAFDARVALWGPPIDVLALCDAPSRGALIELQDFHPIYRAGDVHLELDAAEPTIATERLRRVVTLIARLRLDGDRYARVVRLSLEDPLPEVRHRALCALLDGPDTASLDDLGRWQRATRPSTWAGAGAEPLQGIAVVPDAPHPTATRLRVIADVLARAGVDTWTVATLHQALAHDEPAVRRAAIERLRDVGTAEQVLALRAAAAARPDLADAVDVAVAEIRARMGPDIAGALTLPDASRGSVTLATPLAGSVAPADAP